MKSENIRKILSWAMVLLAMALLCWPALSHILYAVQVVQTANESAVSADVPSARQLETMRQQACDYNDALVGTAPHTLSEAETQQYMSLLNIAGNGVMGRISIPKINVDLPIYHGATGDILQVAAGHMPGTSLPVVSDSSHVVISGHSGLITAALFTDLPLLEIGDTFEITALQQVLVYEVDQIQTVLPQQVETIAVQPGQEYCTLVTCTPLGINTHRLLVRGHRVAVRPQGDDAPSAVATVLRQTLAGRVLAGYETAMLLAALALFCVAFIWPLGKKWARRAGKNTKDRP